MSSAIDAKDPATANEKPYKEARRNIARMLFAPAEAKMAGIRIRPSIRNAPIRRIAAATETAVIKTIAYVWAFSFTPEVKAMSGSKKRAVMLSENIH